VNAGRTSEHHVDVDLVRRTRSGDIGAFELLFTRYQKRVYNIVYGMVGNEADAAELTQDVFVRVFSSIKLLKADEAFLTWLRTVAVNICRDHARKRPAVRLESLEEKISYDGEYLAREIVDTSVGPAGILETKEIGQAVQTAVRSLSDEHRQVISLHHIEGMDLRDIAKSLGCPVGTIKSRLARAREELKRKLAPYVEG
jgi:RNA polymerase sigma-70 factor, ECF subfamily